MSYHYMMECVLTTIDIVSIFLMLCFQDYQKGHEAIVFRLTLTVVF